MTRHLVRALVRRAHQLDHHTVRHGSIEGGTRWDVSYTPGCDGGWNGPARWSVTRAGAYVAR